MFCLICRQAVRMVEGEEVEDVITRAPYRLIVCSACGVIRTWPVPADLAPHYNSELGRLMRVPGGRLHAALKALLLQQEVRRIRKGLSGEVVLDVGCGAGELAALLHAQGISTIAADAASEPPAAVTRHSQIPYYRIAFDTYELQSFSGSTRPLRVVVRNVLEHMRDPLAFLQRMTAYGASSFYVVVPNSSSIERRLFGRHWNLWDPPRHLWHFNARSLTRLLAGAGLHPAQIGYDTIPDLVPSVSRWLRFHHVSGPWMRWLSPRGTLNAISSPLNLLLPRNVIWCLATRLP